MNDEGCGIIVVSALVVLVTLVVIVGLVYEAVLAITVSYADGTVVNTFVSDGETFFTVQLDGTTKREVFSNGDNIFYGKMNSNDFYTRIEIGGHYHFKLTSKRIPILSMFRNVLDVEKTSKPAS